MQLRKPQNSPAHEAAVHIALTAFRQIVGATRRHFQRVQSRCGISGAQLWALWEVNAVPGIKVGDLARRLFIHQSTASNLLKQLAKRGLVERRRVGLDQRVVRLFATEAGRQLLRTAPQPARGVVPDAVDKLSPAQLRQLSRALSAVLAKIHAPSTQAAKQPLADLLR